jgi:hypothetical protein
MVEQYHLHDKAVASMGYMDLAVCLVIVSGLCVAEIASLTSLSAVFLHNINCDLK